MELNSVIQNLEGKTIFITGATGFLAKILVEKILRVQPNIKKLFLLIRASSIGSAEQRLHQEILDTELFRVLREKWGENLIPFLTSKVIPIEGDVSHQNLGITKAELREEMCREIDFIINSAATTRFDERYDVALDINVFGSLNVLNFAKKCPRLKLLLHVSTAYVQGTRSAGVIMERAFHMGETLEGAKASYLDINAEKQIVEGKIKQLQAQSMTHKEMTSILRDLGIQRANLHGWANTYSYTKAMGEMILGSFKDNIRVIIFRPTIITSTYREPFPGWMEGLRTLDSIFAAYAKGNLKVFLGDPDLILDMIPGDMVVNSMLVAMAINSHDDDELMVYHVGSSLKNPITFKETRLLMYDYLKKNPLVDNKSGKPINVRKATTFNSMTSYQRYMGIRYMPLLKMMKLMNVILCKRYETSYVNARRKINRALRLAELYKPYLFFRKIFDDSNTENLRMAMKESNADGEDHMFSFDPRSIQWEDYFMNTHFPGIVKYVLKKK